MPTIKISPMSLSLLIAEAKQLETTIKNVADTIIMEYFSEEAGEEPGAEETDLAGEESGEED